MVSLTEFALKKQHTSFIHWDGRTARRTFERTSTTSHRDAGSHLKRKMLNLNMQKEKKDEIEFQSNGIKQRREMACIAKVAAPVFFRFHVS